jgi:RimJ/RimL family protein N-acetyltransferase
MQSELLREGPSRSPLERQEPLGAMPRALSPSSVLLSERLVLRAPLHDDIDALAHLANNAKVATMVSRMPHPYTAADARAFVDRTANGGIGKAVYAITKADTGQFLGCCGIEQDSDEPARAEIGYWLGEPHWNNGYATEAAQVLVDQAFRSGEILAIDARCRVVNEASRRVIHKCGFQFRGTGMVTSLAMGGPVPVEWYRLDRRTWMSLRSWGGSR